MFSEETTGPRPRSRDLALRHPTIRRRFLEALTAFGNVRAAAREAGVGHSAVYKFREKSRIFAKQWQAALDANADIRWRTGEEAARFRPVSDSLSAQ